MLIERGYLSNVFDPLQPKVDATSKQVDGGGYESVRQWVLANSGLALRSYFAPTLFSTSPKYDAIVVQMDGDVSDICDDFKNSPFSGHFATVADRVTATRSWILCMAMVEPRFVKRIVAAIPTLQMEAWVIAGVSASTENVEARSRKKAAKRILRRKFDGSAVEQVVAAGKTSRRSLSRIMQQSASFSLFSGDIADRFQAST